MATEKRQMIHGVEVVFPCKPYPSQFSMMEKVYWCVTLSEYSVIHFKIKIDHSQEQNIKKPKFCFTENITQSLMCWCKKGMKTMCKTLWKLCIHWNAHFVISWRRWIAKSIHYFLVMLKAIAFKFCLVDALVTWQLHRKFGILWLAYQFENPPWFLASTFHDFITCSVIFSWPVLYLLCWFFILRFDFEGD